MAQTFRTAISFDGLAAASSQALAVKVDGDSENRILVDAGGKITWGAGGSSAGDTTLYRNAANVLKTDDGFVAASVTVPDGGLTLGSTAVTSTAAELNILDGVTSTTSELNILDGVTSTASELNLVDGITAGTVSASKAVIVDSSKDITGFRNITLTGILDAININVNGAQGSDGQVLTSTGSGVAWEDASSGGSPGGSNTQIQFNNSGSFAGNANLVYDGSSLITMTKSGANTGIKLDVASDTEAHSGNIAFYKSEAAGAARLDKDAVYGQIDYYGQTASNGYHHAASIKTLVGEYFYSDNYTPSDIEFWATPADQTSPIRRLVVRGGSSNTDAGALEIWHNGGANKGGRVDFVDDDGTQLGYFGYSNNSAFYIKNNMTYANNGNIFMEAEGDIYVRARGEYEVQFNQNGLEPYADEGYKLGASNREWSEAYIVDLKISGNSTMAGTLTVGVDDTGHDVKFFGATSGKYMQWDESADALIVKDTVDAVNFKVNGGQGSDGQVLTSTGSGVAWEDASGGGGSPGGSDHQVQFNNDGSFGADANFTYDGSNLTAKVPFTVGVDDTGHDVKFFGAASGAYMLYDESENRLDVVTASGAAYFRSLNGTATTYIGSDSGNTALFGTSSAHDTRFITNDTERIRITSDGNVGIGTTSPSTPTHIYHASTNHVLLVESGDSTAGISFKDSATTGNYYDQGIEVSGDTMRIKAGGGSRMVIDSSGNVGIGTTSPSTTLHVNGDFTTDGDIFGTSNTNFFVGNDSNERILFQESSNQIFFYVNGDYRAYINDSGHFVPYVDGTYQCGTSSLRWSSVHSDRYYLADTDSYLQFEADSAAGIDGPGIRFVINGAEMFKVARENDDTNHTMLLLGENNDGIRYEKDNEKFSFVIGASNRLCIENATTSIYGSADILRLYTTASGDQSGYIGFYNNGTTRYGYMGYPGNDDMYFKNENSGGQMYNFSPGSYMYWHVAGAYELRLSSASLRPYSNEGLNLGESGAAWNIFYLGQGSSFSSGGYWTLRSRDSDRQVMEYTSSERFKKDIVDLPVEEAYQILDARPIKFRGIDDDSSVPLEAGLSAESLHNSGFEYAVRYDEGHWGETPRAVYYEMLTAPLIKICKDQKDRIESLEAKVAALEAA